MKLAGIIVVFTAWTLLATPTGAASILDSVHNLSPTGPGNIRAAEQSGVCEFCHTSHQASPVAALWNRNSQGTTYTPYSSSTAIAIPGQPTGSSLLCLSCHDGTVALGDVLSRTTPIAMAGADTMPPGRTRVGTDLRHHHPISFVYDANLAGSQGELALPSALPPEINLDHTGQLQCTSCHDPHDNSLGAFLVMLNQNSSLCLQCHLKDGWSTSSHSQASSSWNGLGTDPWPFSNELSVASNACRNCHEAHQNTGGPILLRYPADVEICAACHNSNVAIKDVMTSFDQLSAHQVASTAQIHDPAEAAVVTDRHVACSDCHNPHKPPPAQPGGTTLRPPPQVRGVDLNNVEQPDAARVYEVCLRCHGDSPGKRTPLVRRQLDQNNVRLEIQPGNPSFHPVAAPGQNQDVPSLIPPWTTQSMMDCVDCHNSSTATTAGGAKGPHGSPFEPILVMNFETTDNTRESPNSYALCYSCHSRNSILNDDSFGEHKKHISGEDTPCSICHDPHGISATQGNATNNTHLINFDTTVVSPNKDGQLRFVNEGRFSGSCDLLCHGKDHRNKSY